MKLGVVMFGTRNQAATRSHNPLSAGKKRAARWPPFLLPVFILDPKQDDAQLHAGRLGDQQMPVHGALVTCGHYRPDAIDKSRIELTVLGTYCHRLSVSVKILTPCKNRGNGRSLSLRFK
ncbi:MAG: hypothetical protein ISP90_18950, partial [Nevskia sp.]|nr:hypothetical protein [Nevskia sp.]